MTMPVPSPVPVTTWEVALDALSNCSSDPSDRYGGPGVWGNALLGPTPSWAVKNSFVHVPSNGDKDGSGIRKTKSANDVNDMYLRFAAKLAGTPDNSTIGGSDIDCQSLPSDEGFYPCGDSYSSDIDEELSSYSTGVSSQPALVKNSAGLTGLAGMRKGRSSDSVFFNTMPAVQEDEDSICMGITAQPANINFTSMMIRNIPNRYSQQIMLAEIDRAGFKGKYSLFYLPIDFGQRANLGYAFIDFPDLETAQLFYSCFHGEKLRKFKSKKILEISPAMHQGLEANLNHFAKAALQRITNPKFRPKVFNEGKGVSFEASYTGLLTGFTGIRVM